MAGVLADQEGLRGEEGDRSGLGQDRLRQIYHTKQTTGTLYVLALLLLLLLLLLLMMFLLMLLLMRLVLEMIMWIM